MPSFFFPSQMTHIKETSGKETKSLKSTIKQEIISIREFMSCLCNLKIL